MKRQLFILIILLLPSFLFAADFEKDIDDIIARYEDDALYRYLTVNRDNPDFTEIEDYILKKVKEIILGKNYDRGKKMLETVLLNNLDNKKAQDMYLSINKYIKEEEDAEIHRPDEQKETIKEVIEPFPLFFTLQAGPVGTLFTYSQFFSRYYAEDDTPFLYHSIILFTYGISLACSIYCVLPAVETGIEVDFDTFFLTIYGEEGTEFFYRIVSSTTLSSIDFPVFLRLGFAHRIYTFSDTINPDVLLASFPSPVIGIGLRRVHFLRDLGINASIDYYCASLLTSYAEVAIDCAVALFYRLYRGTLFSFEINFEISDFIIINNDYIENNTKIVINAGMSINEK
ncbi:MAG: hypothetical protein JW881_14910 [Spirochaetales bacterium]|nr:hypothetical protein [Spirochaetales bacterium]